MKNITIRKMQTAEDFRDLHQMSTSFKVWRDYTVMKVIERKQNHRNRAHIWRSGLEMTRESIQISRFSDPKFSKL